MREARLLGIDVDGVCAGFSEKFVELANRRFGTKYTALGQHDWNFKPWFTGEQVDEVWEKDIKPTKNFWLTLKPLEGTSKLNHLAGLHDANYPSKIEPIFITSRVPTAGMSARAQTCTWLRNWFYIGYPNVIVVEHPSQKVPLVKALELECFIDDKRETIEAMNRAGLRSYAKLAPYNCQTSFPEGVIPVETLDEFLEKEMA